MKSGVQQRDLLLLLDRLQNKPLGYEKEQTQKSVNNKITLKKMVHRSTFV